MWAGVRLASLRASQKVVFFVAKFTREDFLVLREHGQLMAHWPEHSRLEPA